MAHNEHRTRTVSTNSGKTRLIGRAGGMYRLPVVCLPGRALVCGSRERSIGCVCRIRSIRAIFSCCVNHAGGIIGSDCREQGAFRSKGRFRQEATHHEHTENSDDRCHSSMLDCRNGMVVTGCGSCASVAFFRTFLLRCIVGKQVSRDGQGRFRAPSWFWKRAPSS